MHDIYKQTYKQLLRLARREVSSRVYVCVGGRLPTELCDMIIEATYVAERIDILPSALGTELPNFNPINAQAPNWEESPGIQRRDPEWYDRSNPFEPGCWGASDASFGSADLRFYDPEHDYNSEPSADESDHGSGQESITV